MTSSPRPSTPDKVSLIDSSVPRRRQTITEFYDSNSTSKQAVHQTSDEVIGKTATQNRREDLSHHADEQHQFIWATADQGNESEPAAEKIEAVQSTAVVCRRKMNNDCTAANNVQRRFTCYGNAIVNRPKSTSGFCESCRSDCLRPFQFSSQTYTSKMIHFETAKVAGRIRRTRPHCSANDFVDNVTSFSVVGSPIEANPRVLQTLPTVNLKQVEVSSVHQHGAHDVKGTAVPKENNVYNSSVVSRGDLSRSASVDRPRTTQPGQARRPSFWVMTSSDRGHQTRMTSLFDADVLHVRGRRTTFCPNSRIVNLWSRTESG